MDREVLEMIGLYRKDVYTAYKMYNDLVMPAPKRKIVDNFFFHLINHRPNSILLVDAGFLDYVSRYYCKYINEEALCLSVYHNEEEYANNLKFLNALNVDEIDSCILLYKDQPIPVERFFEFIYYNGPNEQVEAPIELISEDGIIWYEGVDNYIDFDYMIHSKFLKVLDTFESITEIKVPY